MYEASRVSHHLITHMLVILFKQVSTRALDPLEAPLEAWWAKHQGIAGGAIKITSMLISASGLPGAGALSAVMDKVVIAAAGATENRESCKRLAFLVRTCDIALSDAGSKSSLCASGHAEELLASLKGAMEEAAQVAEEFGQKGGMVMRLVKYSGDADAFKQVHNRLGDCMKVRMPTVPLHPWAFFLKCLFFGRGSPSTCPPLCGRKCRPSSTSCWRR